MIQVLLSAGAPRTAPGLGPLPSLVAASSSCCRLLLKLQIFRSGLLQGCSTNPLGALGICASWKELPTKSSSMSHDTYAVQEQGTFLSVAPEIPGPLSSLVCASDAAAIQPELWQAL